MNPKPISPRTHALLDYPRVGNLLTLPSVVGFSRSAKNSYTAEALVLLGCLALTDLLVALTPFPVHGE